MAYEKRYKEALSRAREKYHAECLAPALLEYIFPELKESEDEKIRKEIIDVFRGKTHFTYKNDADRYIAWLEKQGSEPNWCHHKVDLSNCSEEYRKAYYDGWNNCNQQHSQCKFDSEDEKMWKLIKKYAHYKISDLTLEADHITREQLESWLEMILKLHELKML